MPLLTQEQYKLKPGESVTEYQKRIERLREEAGEGGGEKTEDKNQNKVPDYIANDSNLMDLYEQITDEEKAFVKVFASVLEQDNTETKETMLDALEKAKEQADPYFAEQIRIAQENLESNLGYLEESLESKEERLQKKVKRINEDLRVGKRRISVDKQAELARQKRKYEKRLENLQQNVRSQGLTFSTKRRRARSRLEEERRDIVESTRREAQRRREDIETKSERGIEDTGFDLEEFTKDIQQRGEELVTQAESKVGTKQLPNLGTTFEGSGIGGVRGSLEDEKKQSIASRASSMMELSKALL